MGVFRWGPLIPASKASDPVWASRPCGWPVGIQPDQGSSEPGSGPLAPTSGEACETCISQVLPQTCWGPRNLHLKPIPQVSLMSTQVRELLCPDFRR